MISRDQFIETVRAWLDVPFKHQGRTRAGIDCAGLLIRVANELALSGFDTTDYNRQPSGHQMQQIMQQHLVRIKPRDLSPADVLHMAYKGQPQHIAIITRLDPVYIIHADANAGGGGRVVEHRLDSRWLRRVRGVYRVPGVV